MQDLTSGSISGHLLKTTGFMLVSMVFQTLYVLIDLYWVGRLGTDAVAAVAISGNLTFVVVALTQMLAVGTTTLVSHAVGRKDRDRALLVFNQAIVLSVTSGAVFFILATAVRPAYTQALSADAATMRLAGDYLSWFIPAMALQFGLVALGAALRGTGNFKPGMVVQTGTVVLNMVLAPFLVFGWGTGHPLGVAGAAIATFVAIGIGTVWMTTYFAPLIRAATDTTGSYLQFLPADWTPRLDLWWGMLKIGLPAGAEFGLMAVYLFLVYSVSRPFGAAAQAGFGIGLRIVQACFLPVVALGFAVAPVAGQNFGARIAERVRLTFTLAASMAAGFMVLCTALAHLAPAAMIRVFSSDPQVIAVGDEYLRIISWNFLASGIIFVSSSTFQAMGNTIPSLMTSFTRMFIVAIPTLVVARLPGFELRWIWYLSVASVIVQLAMNLLLLRREFRVRLNFEPVAADRSPLPAAR